MYLAFAAAPLPIARMATSEALYYHAHPTELETRDTAMLVVPLVAAFKFLTAVLAVGALLALYFLVTGPRAARVSAAALIAAWLLLIAAIFFLPLGRPNSLAELYVDAVRFVALCALPWICAGVRFARSRDQRSA
jgi:L-alanine-DL-glutamate epimerase-like enolase superfamily enzyme